MLSKLDRFWGQYPALLYGLSILLGCSASLRSHFFAIPAVMILLPLSLKSSFSYKWLWLRLFNAFLLGLTAFIYTSSNIHLPTSLQKQGVEGVTLFQISSVQESHIFFGKSWLYKGSLRTFVSHNSTKNLGKNCPCSIFYKSKSERPVANRDYYIQGKLKKSYSGNYILVPQKEKPWIAVPNSFSLGEYRYQIQQKVSKWIRASIKDSKSASFLSGIATGKFDDLAISSDFSRFGLQHIMAISGFHFSIVAAMLGLLFSCLIERKKSVVVVLFLLTVYFLFLGCSPSVMRAWLTSFIFLSGHLFERQGSAINSLGLTLGVCLLIDPLYCMHLGFQFSFLTTAAILFFYSGIDQYLQTFFPKRQLSSLVEMDWLNQHGYVVLTFFRQSLALTIAVHLVAIPVVLYYFHKFPLMSLIYNCFFPFLVSFSMILLMVAILFGLLFPPLGTLIHSLNSFYTHMILSLTSNIPTSLDYYLRCRPFSPYSLIIYLAFLFLGGMLIKNYIENKRAEAQDLAFL